MKSLVKISAVGILAYTSQAGGCLYGYDNDLSHYDYDGGNFGHSTSNGYGNSQYNNYNEHDYFADYKQLINHPRFRARSAPKPNVRIIRKRVKPVICLGPPQKAPVQKKKAHKPPVRRCCGGRNCHPSNFVHGRNNKVTGKGNIVKGCGNFVCG